MQPATKSSLSHSRAQLVERMQRLGFGTIENLTIRDGEPVLDPPPRVIRDAKLGGESGPCPGGKPGDFALKAQVLDLLTRLDRIGNGTIRCLEVKHGLPFRMQWEETTA